MRFDPFIDGQMAERYPDIALRPVFVQNDGLLRMAILFASPDSPLSGVRDFKARMEEAFTQLKCTPDVKEQVTTNSPAWAQVLYELFRLVNDIDYEVWWSTKQSFHILSDKLRSPQSMKDNDRLRVSKELDGLRMQLKEIEYGLFKDDYLKDSITQQAVAASLMGHAEANALPSP